MKKIILLLAASAMLLYATPSKSQTINGMPISEIDAQYISVTTIQKGMSKKTRVMVDFGQDQKLTSQKDVIIRDANGKHTAFKSTIDVLNYFHRNGYEFVSHRVHMLPGALTANQAHEYLLRKL